jgi:hypothetical protein
MLPVFFHCTMSPAFTDTAVGPKVRLSVASTVVAAVPRDAPPTAAPEDPEDPPPDADDEADDPPHAVKTIASAARDPARIVHFISRVPPLFESSTGPSIPGMGLAQPEQKGSRAKDESP